MAHYIEDSIKFPAPKPTTASPVQAPPIQAPPVRPSSHAAASGTTREQDVLFRKIRESTHKVLGGILFEDEADGFPRVGFAVNRGSFDPGQLERRIYALQYNLWGLVLPLSARMTCQDYHVFIFQSPRGARSLRNAIHERKVPVSNVFLKNLLLLLHRYQETLTGGDGYLPLGLCPDTVYLTPDNNLYILPIYDSQPGVLPSEICIEPTPSVSSDVYSACLLAQELAYSNLIDEGNIPPKPENELICQALLPCAAWRPSIEELLAELNTDPDEMPVFASPTPPAAANPFRSFMSRICSGEEEELDEDDYDYEDEDQPGILQFLQGKAGSVLGRLSEAVSDEMADQRQRHTGTKKGGL